MAFDYTDIAATAREMLVEFGRECVLRRIEASYDPATSSAQPQTMDFVSVGVALDYRQNEIDGTNVRQGDQKVYMPPEGLPRPKSGDQILLAGRWLNVVSVMVLEPGGPPVLYIVQARGV